MKTKPYVAKSKESAQREVRSLRKRLAETRRVYEEICTRKDAEAQKLELAIRWALGENGNFRYREDGEGQYWWRQELRARAGL